MDRSVGYGQKAMEIETLRSSGFPTTHWKQIPADRTAAGRAAIYIDNMQEIGTPPRAGGGGKPDNFLGQGLELDHTAKSYTNRQHTGFILVNLRWRTRNGTHGRNYGPTDNMQFLVWPVHRTFARQ